MHIPYLTLNPYVVGTQKNRLTKKILLSTHNIGFGRVIGEILVEKHQFTPPNLDLYELQCSERPKEINKCGKATKLGFQS